MDTVIRLTKPFRDEGVRHLEAVTSPKTGLLGVVVVQVVPRKVVRAEVIVCLAPVARDATDWIFD